MKKMRSLFLISLTIICFFLEHIVIACGGGDYFMNDTSFMHNNAVGSPGFSSFYFIPGISFYDDWEHSENEDLNIKEWQNYADYSFSEKDAALFIYKYSYEELRNLYFHIEKGDPLEIEEEKKSNEMTIWFLKNKDLEALGYLMYAKQCEEHAFQDDVWSLPKRNEEQMGNLVKNGLQLWDVAKHDFIKWRYGYQILRLSFYANRYQYTLELFDKLIGNQAAENISYFRALGLKAGALYKLKDFNQAAYLYSLAFDGTDDNKKGMYISYLWCFSSNNHYAENSDKAHLSEVLKLARNNSEKAVIELMSGFSGYESAIPVMKKAYQLDPLVKGIDVIMVREINKIETQYLRDFLVENSGFHSGNRFYYRNNGDFEKSRNKTHQEIHDLITFSEKIIQDGHVDDLAFWPMAIAYLYYIKQDFSQSKAWIKKAEALQPEGKLQGLLHLHKLLVEITSSPKLDKQVEQAILPSLEWLEKEAQHDSKYYKSYQALLKNVLPNAYMKQGDTLQAVLSITKSMTNIEHRRNKAGEYYIEPGFFEELDQLSKEKIIQIQSKMRTLETSKYEDWLINKKAFKEDELSFYIGSRFLRDFDFEHAVAVLKELPQSLLDKYVFPDPFLERYKDDQIMPDGVRMYNRLEFAKEMAALKSKINNRSKEQLIYKYATGLYSMTYYGLAWKAGNYWRSSIDKFAYFDANREVLLSDLEAYYSASEAKKYYQMAFDKSKDDEFKAKALFMISKCEQKNNPISATNYLYKRFTDYRILSLESLYFKELEKNYRHTKTFDIIRKECAYFDDYISIKR